MAKSRLLPRERLFRNGAKTLTDDELLSLLLRTGHVPRNNQDSPLPRVSAMARDLIHRAGGLTRLFSASAEELCELPGLGPAKAASLLAVREISTRLWQYDERITHRPKVQSAADAYRLFSGMTAETQEIVSALFLTTRNEVIRVQEIFRGTLSSSPACPREILREALRANAAKFMVAHNHPSGTVDPSAEDEYFTLQLEAAGELVNIPLVDHLIVCRGGRFFSFAEAKRIGQWRETLKSPADPRPRYPSRKKRSTSLHH